MPEPIQRPTARVLPVDRHGRVLVLTVANVQPGAGLMTAGGGIEPGETPHQAAVRELREETGIEIAIADLVGPVHRGHRPWTDEHGRAWVNDSQFFAVRVHDAVVDFAGHQPDEEGFITGHAWLTPQQLHDDPRSHDQLARIADLAVAAVGEAR